MQNSILVNGQWLAEQSGESHIRSQSEKYFDRIESFGDGVFESMLVKRGNIHLYKLHKARLLRGLDTLKIDAPLAKIESDIALVLTRIKAEKANFFRLKLRVSRGSNAAGYASTGLEARRILSYGEYTPALLPSASLMISSVKLPTQPLLAGIKHCSRLEQVLAKREQEQTQFDDALMLGADGHIIEATSSNVFILQGDTLFTPDLSNCGVDGVMRTYIMQTAAAQCQLQIQQKQLKIADLKHAQGLFLCNALFGIRLVNDCQLASGEQLRWSPDDRLLQLQKHIFSAISDTK